MVSSRLDGNDGSVFESTAEVGVLPVLAIYGANASGKTNVLRALHYFCVAVRDSQNTWKPNSSINHQPFAGASGASVTSFEVDFLISKERYSYGFELSAKEITKEWLYTYPNKRKQILFERNGHVFSYGKNLAGNKKLIESLVRPNSLFLSAAAQNNHELLFSIYDWITDWIVITDERDPVVQVAAKICEDPEACELLSALVRNADLGIVGMETKRREPDAKAIEMLNNLVRGLPEKMAEEVQNQALNRVHVSFLHAGPSQSKFAVESTDESRGTLNYFGLIAPITSVLEQGGLIIVDELDESLHPSLIKGILQLFVSKNSNPHGAQLIFNTHDTNLLDLDLIRRDEIWFAEKDAEGATHIYPLTDYKPRNSENVQKGYLEGRYGAIPFVGDFVKLVGQEVEAHR